MGCTRRAPPPLAAARRNGRQRALARLTRVRGVQGWRPNISMRQVVTGIQKLLAEPNESSPAQAEAYMFYTTKRKEYCAMVVEQARRYTLAG
jgi:ubiquitin-protein ligase